MEQDTKTREMVWIGRDLPQLPRWFRKAPKHPMSGGQTIKYTDQTGVYPNGKLDSFDYVSRKYKVTFANPTEDDPKELGCYFGLMKKSRNREP
eukprot:UN07956